MSESSYPSSPAGPSSYNPAQTPPPPPEAIERDDYAAAEQARQRFQKRGFFSSVSLPLPHRHKSSSRKRGPSPSPSSIAELERPASTPPEAPEFVELSERSSTTELDEDYGKDVYRWAVLFENQRGYVRVVTKGLRLHQLCKQSHSVLDPILFAPHTPSSGSTPLHYTDRHSLSSEEPAHSYTRGLSLARWNVEVGFSGLDDRHAWRRAGAIRWLRVQQVISQQKVGS